jgi:hypothetical protein
MRLQEGFAVNEKVSADETTLADRGSQRFTIVKAFAAAVYGLNPIW